MCSTEVPLTPSKSVLATTAALLLVFGGVIAALFSGSAHAATSTLCQEQTAPVGGSYIVQNNEYDSSASECVTTDGNADFTVANSGIANATNGSPGAYPSIYQGCHWGNCSSGGLTSHPDSGLEPDLGQGDHELVHHAAGRQQRLRRGLRHLVQPDTDHHRPAERHRAHGLA